MYLCTIDHDFPFEFPRFSGGERRHRLRFRKRFAPWNPIPGTKWILPFRPHQGRKIRLEYQRRGLRQSGHYTLSIEGIGEFRWTERGGEVRYRVHCRDSQRLRYWLLHLVLPLYLQVEGVYEILHASGVVLAGKALVFSAPSHGGKSTLAGYFVRRGHPLLSDDKLPLFMEGSRYRVAPSHPWIRLHRGEEELGERWDRDFVTASVPLGAVCFPEWRPSGESPRLIEMTGKERFRRLISGRQFLPLPVSGRDVFCGWAAFSRDVPLYRLLVPRDLSRIGEVYRKIVDTLPLMYAMDS
jgi:hypothetical protein